MIGVGSLAGVAESCLVPAVRLNVQSAAPLCGKARACIAAALGTHIVCGFSACGLFLGKEEGLCGLGGRRRGCRHDGNP